MKETGVRKNMAESPFPPPPSSNPGAGRDGGKDEISGGSIEAAETGPAKNESEPLSEERAAKIGQRAVTVRPGAMPRLPKKFGKKDEKENKEERSGEEADRLNAGEPLRPKPEIPPPPESENVGLNKKEPSLSDLALPKAWRSPVPPEDPLDEELWLPPTEDISGKKNECGDKPVTKGKARIGDYTLISCLGSGGMAVIYKSIQRTLNRTVALKVLKPEVAREEQFVQRFEREALTLASLQQENIIQVYAHHKDPRFQYFVMEYVDGVDLFDLMERCGPLPGEVAAVISLQTARALEHAHYRGIIHRDVKPANLMISYSGVVKLMDFGIARVPDSEELTQHGTGLGTPSYMSPEQVVGDHLDGRTDIFSLGSVLFQMLTGEKPFIADENETVLQKIRIQPTPNVRKLRPELPRSLERILLRCMQKRKDDRYRPTRELVRAFERFLSNRGIESENALLVNFFLEKGFIDEKAAGDHLERARKSGYKSSSPGRSKLPSAKSAAIAGMVATGVFLLLAGVLLGKSLFSTDKTTREETVKTSFSAHEDESGDESDIRPTSLSHEGIRVIVKPWAHLYIRGKRVATTPFDNPLKLEPGSHSLRLYNPYCKEKKLDIVLKPGEIRTIHEKLECSGPAVAVREGEEGNKEDEEIEEEERVDQ